MISNKKYTDAELCDHSRSELVDIIRRLNNELTLLTEGQYTRQTLAAYMKVSTGTLDGLRRTAPNFPVPARIGGKLLWSKSVIDQYLARLTTVAA